MYSEQDQHSSFPQGAPHPVEEKNDKQNVNDYAVLVFISAMEETKAAGKMFGGCMFSMQNQARLS